MKQLKGFVSRLRYDYGWIVYSNNSFRNRARLDLVTGKVEFRLWEKGKFNHTVDYWYPMGIGWDSMFMTIAEYKSFRATTLIATHVDTITLYSILRITRKNRPRSIFYVYFIKLLSLFA